LTLALLLLRGRKAGTIKRAVATVFEPASEHGQKGMDELHQQTVNLLSFQPLPKDIFDAQIAFNMLPRYGQKAQRSLDSVETRILRHYRKIAGDNLEPSLFVLQTPIFHGYALALSVEFDGPVETARLSQVLAGDHVAIAAEEAPSNVSSAGQGDIQLMVKPDAVNPNAVWLWAAADNLRIAAITAVECAESMAATRPTGKIQ
jgi:aspartate-semialdehyde dehydrogenase